jgi:glycine/D-amino acid oxidase-like deaminating enzyme
MDLTSGAPFWPVKDGLIDSYPRLDADSRATVAVLGAGITGALIAHRLGEAGIDVIVLDKRDVASGSTSASTALLQYEIDVTLADLTKMHGSLNAGRAYLACLDAVRKLGELADALPEDVGFARKKSLYLASKKRDRRILRGEWSTRRALGIEVEWLDEADIASRFSFSRPCGILSADGAQVDAYAFAHALLREAERNGARVFDRTKIAKIDAGNAGVTLVTDNGIEVTARYLVFATGYETEEYLSHKVAKLASTYAIASEPVSAFDGWGEDRCIIWEHADPYLYLRTTVDNRIIVGGEDEPFRNPVIRDRLIPRKRDRLVKRAREMFPEIVLEPAFAWTGTFGETKDGLAYIGEHRDWPSCHFALGYGGNGITFAMIAAEIIRDAVLGRINSNADLFRFDRD